MIHLDILKTFVDVAQTGSFRAAAERNFMTQPAVSQQIKQLEERLGTILFERKSKKVHLTSSGQIFLNDAQNILKTYEEAKSRLHEQRGEMQGLIRIATIHSIGIHELQPVVRRYLLQCPKVEFQLEYHPFNQIYEMVFNREVDFGLVAFPARRFGIVTEIFDEEELVLVQSSHHGISKIKIRTPSDLDGIKFVTFAAGTPTRSAIDQYLRENRSFPRVVSEYGDIETLKSAVELGIGYSILPRRTILHELREGTVKVVTSVKITVKRPLGILYPKGQEFSKCTQAFYKLIMKKRKQASL